MRRLAWLASMLAVVLAALFVFGPREPVDLVPAFSANRLPGDLDAYLSTREAVVGGITPGAEKRIRWAGEPGAQTGWAVIYLHGFSATAEEIRPVPDNVARALGANLFFTRFAGHGLGPGRFAGPSINDWMVDVAEALAIGRRIGKRVLVIATSTGGTLAAEAALQADLVASMDAVVFVSPNFGLNVRGGGLLTLPMVRYWGPIVAGDERCFEARNPRQARFWTTCYPTVALLPMAALARHAGRADYGTVGLPALFLYSREDNVVSPAATEAVITGWGGEATGVALTMGAGDDAGSHVIAGDIMSPGQTAPVTALILDWLAGL